MIESPKEWWTQVDVAEDEQLNEEVADLKAENEQLKKEVADYHQLQWQHDALIEDYEKLRAENAKLEDDWQESYAEECITRHENHRLEEENARLKCLALHLFEVVANKEAGEWAEFNDCLPLSRKNHIYKQHEERWQRIAEKCSEEHSKAKKALMEGSNA